MRRMGMIMFQYVLFDLDGTLTDPKEGITKSVQFALRRRGIHEPDLNKLEPFIGPPLVDSFMDFYGMTQEEATFAVADYRERFAPIGIFENKVYPGIPEMLEHLKEAGVKLAVASSKPEVYVERILEHFGLKSYFDVVTGSDLNGSRCEKEEVVEETLRRLAAVCGENDDDVIKAGEEIDRSAGAMVGDRKFDISGAKEFGLTSIGVSYGYAAKGELKNAGADYIVRSVRELEKLLLGNKAAWQTGGGPMWKRRTSGGGPAMRQGQANDGGAAPAQAPAENSSVFLRTWHMLLPFILYYLGYNACYLVIATMVQLLTGVGETTEAWFYENKMAVTYLTRAVSIMAGAGILVPLWRRERTKWPPRRKISFLTLGILAGTAALGVNILFALLKITELSAQYTEVQRTQYQMPLVWGLFLYGLITPAAEELLFRGLIYNRMKKYFSVLPAAVVSSVLFGAYHGNPVQALYGTLLGLVIVDVYEMTGDFKAPVFVHGVANAVVFALTYDPAVSAAIGTPVNCAIFLTLCGLSLLRIHRRAAQR